MRKVQHLFDRGLITIMLQVAEDVFFELKLSCYALQEYLARNIGSDLYVVRLVQRDNEHVTRLHIVYLLTYNDLACTLYDEELFQFIGMGFGRCAMLQPYYSRADLWCEAYDLDQYLIDRFIELKVGPVEPFGVI